MKIQPILIDGRWLEATSKEAFQAVDPGTGQPLADLYPVSTWEDLDAALAASERAADTLRGLSGSQIGDFLEHYAKAIEDTAEEIVAMANRETALPVRPRLGDVELPRTTGQLRQAAVAAREGSWRTATIDAAANIRSQFAPLGTVCVFGPNNFPLAFNAVSGGDFVAAIAAGNPVIAKAHPNHPGTTRLLAEAARKSLQEADLPEATVQLIYHMAYADGDRLVADPRVGATAYTGSRNGGLKLKAAADLAGRPIYLELSSVNPVFMLPGALEERGEAIAEEFSGSCLMAAGQFCTNPGMVFLVAGPETEAFIEKVTQGFQATNPGTLFSTGVRETLTAGIAALKSAGATVLAGDEDVATDGVRYANTLLRVSGKTFLEHPTELQTEAFGNESLLVVASDSEQLVELIDHLEGNLTGCIYSQTGGEDDALYEQIADRLRPRVGRLLNDKMPTGVAVSPAMQHGGPYPASGHAGFTAVGIPASLKRFAMLECYDNVRPHRLPSGLQNKNPNGNMWRLIDGAWTQGDVGA